MEEEEAEEEEDGPVAAVVNATAEADEEEEEAEEDCRNVRLFPTTPTPLPVILPAPLIGWVDGFAIDDDDDDDDDDEEDTVDGANCSLISLITLARSEVGASDREREEGRGSERARKGVRK